MRRAILTGLVLDAVVLLGWFILGEPIFQRGVGAFLLYLVLITAFVLGFGYEAEIQDAIETIKRERPAPAAPAEAAAPGDKGPMRTAVMAGVLEAIKGLVVRSESAEQRLKELELRMSELSLAAGLKVRPSPRNIGDPTQ